MKTLLVPEWDKEVREHFIANPDYYLKEIIKRYHDRNEKFQQRLIRNLKIVRLYYKTNLTLKETGKPFGISPERVRQICARYMRIMRHIDYLKEKGKI